MGIFISGISVFVLEISTFLYYADEESNDAKQGSHRKLLVLNNNLFPLG